MCGIILPGPHPLAANSPAPPRSPPSNALWQKHPPLSPPSLCLRLPSSSFQGCPSLRQLSQGPIPHLVAVNIPRNRDSLSSQVTLCQHAHCIERRLVMNTHIVYRLQRRLHYIWFSCSGGIHRDPCKGLPSLFTSADTPGSFQSFFQALPQPHPRRFTSRRAARPFFFQQLVTNPHTGTVLYIIRKLQQSFHAIARNKAHQLRAIDRCLHPRCS